MLYSAITYLNLNTNHLMYTFELFKTHYEIICLGDTIGSSSVVGAMIVVAVSTMCAVYCNQFLVFENHHS